MGDERSIACGEEEVVTAVLVGLQDGFSVHTIQDHLREADILVIGKDVNAQVDFSTLTPHAFERALSPTVVEIMSLIIEFFIALILLATTRRRGNASSGDNLQKPSGRVWKLWILREGKIDELLGHFLIDVIRNGLQVQQIISGSDRACIAKHIVFAVDARSAPICLVKVFSQDAASVFGFQSCPIVLENLQALQGLHSLELVRGWIVSKGIDDIKIAGGVDHNIEQILSNVSDI